MVSQQVGICVAKSLYFPSPKTEFTSHSPNLSPSPILKNQKVPEGMGHSQHNLSDKQSHNNNSHCVLRASSLPNTPFIGLSEIPNRPREGLQPLHLIDGEREVHGHTESGKVGCRH
jgi:hypothetical protein